MFKFLIETAKFLLFSYLATREIKRSIRKIDASIEHVIDWRNDLVRLGNPICKPTINQANAILKGLYKTKRDLKRALKALKAGIGTFSTPYTLVLNTVITEKYGY